MRGPANDPRHSSVLTGYLGAGKTTLLNRVLKENHGKKYAVIVNEFGEIGIDNDLVVGADEEIFEMNNGCICCTVRGDLIRIIGGLMKRSDNFDAILVETTGLADPAPVAQTFFTDEDVRRRTKLDGVVTVVDAKHVAQTLDDGGEAREQIAFADVILVNKTDLVEPAEIKSIESRIRALNPYAKIHLTDRCAIDLNHILDRGAFDLDRILEIDPEFLHDDHASDHGHDHEHNHEHRHDPNPVHSKDIRSVSFSTDRPINPQKFDAWVNDILMSQGQDILRTKGILNMAGDDRRFVFQAVHMMSEGAFTGPWPTSDNRGSRLVFIGRNLDEAALKQGFEACAA